MTPFFTPFVNLLKSRKVIIALVSIAVNLLLLQFPDLAPMREIIFLSITALALAVIGGIAWEDTAKSATDAAKLPPRSNEDLARELANDFISVFIRGQENVPQAPPAPPAPININNVLPTAPAPVTTPLAPSTGLEMPFPTPPSNPAPDNPTPDNRPPHSDGDPLSFADPRP